MNLDSLQVHRELEMFVDGGTTMKFPLAAIAVAVGLTLQSPAFAETVFYVGYNNGGTSEFEQEGGARNDANYYAEAVDFSGIAGLNGSGQDRSSFSGPEIWQDGPSSADWANSTEGFARAITSGFTTGNVFFTLEPEQAGVGNTFILQIDYVSPKAGTTHDVDYYMNNVLVGSVTGIDSNQLIEITFPASAVSAVAGPNVVSWRRTGGVLTSGSAWISMDYVALDVVPEPSTLALLLSLAGVGLLGWTKRRWRS